MRLTLPLLARPKAAKLSPLNKPETLESYLSTLKATQLRSLARETGIPNSGRKDELRQRLNDVFLTSVFLDDGASRHQARPRKKDEGKGLSVLSIDMGIQNLAFAHLIVRAPETVLETRDADKKQKGLVTLNAWHRIGVQELGAGSPAPGPATQDADTEVKLKSLLPPSAFRTFTSTTKNQALEEFDAIEEELPTMKIAAANKNFEPDTLSHNAFVLLSSLLQAYKPTHILIERQRFRSGGQSAVLEWSLRVGVFEGMLHAVLRTMRELARVDKSRSCEEKDFQVHPISPARIMQFWDESKSSIEGDDSSEKGKGQSQRGVKKQKMDIVGHLLSASSSSDLGKRGLLCWDVDINTTDTDKQNVSDVVDAYLGRWNPQLLKIIPSSTTSKAVRESKSDVNKKAYKIEKMDDLADCLLQGLTWLEWQARRARIVRGDRQVDV
ncbi:uncharacterized protein BHQ10_000134 [Talaromyces amestolkiae]|uniref:SAP domain-containing protein n=1 Tax=Talaromyces amestolkiae TaxID=1196081 RepID=A0A364KKQ3_TALAM|nr:uncharacterized protein BHQ10_000134 [Talaromyces amestolkiae]RAO64122.1 hypothetical protein BHQ10_000134 [Talaromyces amestolkiae]